MIFKFQIREIGINGSKTFGKLLRRSAKIGLESLPKVHVNIYLCYVNKKYIQIFLQLQQTMSHAFTKQKQRNKKKTEEKTIFCCSKQLLEKNSDFF